MILLLVLDDHQAAEGDPAVAEEGPVAVQQTEHAHEGRHGVGEGTALAHPDEVEHPSGPRESLPPTMPVTGVANNAMLKLHI